MEPILVVYHKCFLEDRKSCVACFDDGGVLVECTALVGILLLVVFTGTLSVGAALSQITSMSQVAYQAALLGGETLPAQASYASNQRAQTLFQLRPNQNILENNLIVATAYSSANDTVSVSVQSSLSPMFEMFSIPVQVKMVAPYLLTVTESNTDPNSFVDSIYNLYCCNNFQSCSKSPCTYGTESDGPEDILNLCDDSPPHPLCAP